MPKSSSYKVFLESDGKIYSFLAHVLEEADGSFYIIFQREGKNYEHLILSSDNKKLQRITLDYGRDKSKRISYHSTGCVRYHNLHQPDNYFEPLYNLKQPNLVASLIVPSIKSLDLYNKELSDKDFVYEINNDNQQIQFDFVIAPWDTMIASEHISLRYKDFFSFNIIKVVPPTISVPDLLHNHFIFITPQQGIYNQRPVDKHSALISFHQKLHDFNGVILKSPDKKGVYKIICAVPMRIPPETEIQFLDKQYSAEIESKTESVVRFKVKDRHGHTVKQEVQITGLTLCAEL